jgi:hypothetical protein
VSTNDAFNNGKPEAGADDIAAGHFQPGEWAFDSVDVSHWNAGAVIAYLKV